jgi:putative DNA methylase
VYLAFAVDRCCDFNNSLTGWRPGNEKIMGLFNRQAIPMVWDYGEANILANVVGGFITNINYQVKCIGKVPAVGHGYSKQEDAVFCSLPGCIISTDPPYYDNIGYADLSDFFYVWLRRSLKNIFPDIFATMLVPKEPELVATPYRHGSKDKAEKFFMDGMTQAIINMSKNSHPAFPVTIYYAFKQSETKKKGTASSGWETFLDAVKIAGFSITGTWPMRSEQSTRMVGMGTNALASSIVLVCRKRSQNAPTISRKQFLRELDNTLPEALEEMIGGAEGISPIAPVDLAQAAIGPGMAVFSRYEAVLEADGSPMTVHNALILINKSIDEYFSQAESDMDSDTRFCVDWFLQYGFAAGQFGEADVLARAKGTTVDGVTQAGVLESGGGKVRLLRKDEYPADWDPATDTRVPVWEACHHLCRALGESETAAGTLLARMPEKGEPVRQLAYRLYTQCERKGWAEDARVYNELITSWQAILEVSRQAGESGTQMNLFE